MARNQWKRGSLETLSTGEYVTEAEAVSSIEFREKIVNFLIVAYSVSLIVTFTIILFQGFRCWDFDIGKDVINYLIGALIGELAGLFAMVISFLFPSPFKRKNKD